MEIQCLVQTCKQCVKITKYMWYTNLFYNFTYSSNLPADQVYGSITNIKASILS